ncbi:MAG: hypothetical protein LBF12_03420 [Christensenellaceae bacterium]|jgi:phosphopantetheinyl transferase|nr:hypothetical protein [Christensenellaceae bacterium]
MLIVFSKNKQDSDLFILKTIEKYLVSEGCVGINAPQVNRIKGKPFNTNPPPYISLSHSSEYIVCTAACLPVGVDVQIMKDMNFEKFSKRYYNRIVIDKFDFYKYWTFAEAKAKRNGNPLVEELKNADFSDCKTIDFIENYTLAVCTNDKSPITFWDLDNALAE